MPFASREDLDAFLDKLGVFHMDLGLERMRRGIVALGLERPSFAVTQIVGTNGKGSTASFLAALGTAHGVKTGLFTSPHMLDPRERIRIDGKMPDERHWLELARAVHLAEPELTYFEFICLMACLAFAEQGVELAVMEAGLGGRSDATTALSAELVCFTPIERDHANVLGNSLEAIADDKADAMRYGALALSAAQVPEVEKRLLVKARELGLDLLWSGDLPDSLDPGLQGPHQRENAALALAAWVNLARRHTWPTRRNAVRSALATAFIPGRLHTLEASGDLPHMLLDGAHNMHALLTLHTALRVLGIKPCALVFSCLSDKEPQEMCRIVGKMAGKLPLFVPPVPHNPRAVLPEEMAELLGPRARPCASLHEALLLAASLSAGPQNPVLVCGSLYLVAEVFKLHPEGASLLESKTIRYTQDH